MISEQEEETATNNNGRQTTTESQRYTYTSRKAIQDNKGAVVNPRHPGETNNQDKEHLWTLRKQLAKDKTHGRITRQTGNRVRDKNKEQDTKPVFSNSVF